MVANSKFVKQIDIIFNALGADKVTQHANMLIHQLKILQNEAMKGMALAEKKNDPKLLSAWSDVSRQITTALKLQKDSRDYTVRDLKTIAEKLGVVEAKAKALGKTTNFKYKTGLDKYKDEVKELLELYTSLGGKVNKNLIKKIDSDNSQDLQKANKTLKERIRLLKEASKLNGIVDDKTYNSLVGKISNRSSLKGLHDVNAEIKQLVESNKQRIKEEAQLLKSVGKESSIVANSIGKLKKKYDSLKFSLDKTIISQERWTKSEHTEKAKQVVQNIEAKENRLIRLSLAYQKVEQRLQEYIRLNDLARIKRANANLQRLEGIINNEAVAFDNLSRNARRATEDLKKLSRVKWFIETGKRAMAYAGMYGGMFASIGAIKNAVEYSNQLDQSQQQLKGVLKMSGLEAEQLTKKIQIMGETYGGSIEEIKNVALELGRAGMANKDLATATDVVIRMALLTGDSYEVATGALVSFNEVFGEQIKQTYKGGNVLEILGNKLAAIANDSRMTTQDIGTFANYALAMSKQVGLSVDMVGAMAVAFNNAGNNASTIGTMIRRFGTSLSTTTPKIKKFWESIGIDQKELRNNLQAGGAVAEKAWFDFLHKIGSLSKSELSELTGDLGTLFQQTFNGIANQYSVIEKETKRLKNTISGEFDGVKDIIISNSKVWERFKNTIGDVADQVIRLPLDSFFGGIKSLMGIDDNKSFAQIAEDSKKFADNVAFAIKQVINLGLAFATLKIGSSILAGLSLGMNKLRAVTRLAKIGLVATTGSATTAGVAVRALGIGFRFISRTILPLALLTEGFNLLFSRLEKNRQKAIELKNAFNISINQFKQLGEANKNLTIFNLNEKIFKDLQRIVEIKAELDNGKGLFESVDDWNERKLNLEAELETLNKQVDKAREKLSLMKEITSERQNSLNLSQNVLDIIKQNTNELQNTNLYANELSNSFYNAVLQATNIENGVIGVNNQLVNSISLAYSFSNALGNALVGFKIAQMKLQGLSKTKILEFQITNKSNKLSELYKKDEQATKLAQELITKNKIKQSDIDSLDIDDKRKKLVTEIISIERDRLNLADSYKKSVEQTQKHIEKVSLELKKIKNLNNATGKFGDYKARITNAKLELEAVKKAKYNTELEKELAIAKALNKVKTAEKSLQSAIESSKKKSIAAANKVNRLAKKKAKAAQRLHNTQTKVNASLEEQKSILKQIEDLKKNWWNFDKDSVKTAKEKWELAKKQVETLKTNSNKLTVEKAITKEYKARLAYLQAQHNKLKEIYNIMSSGVDKMFSGDIGEGISSIFSGLGNKFLEPLKNQFSAYLTKISSSILGSFGGLTGSWITLGIKALGSLFSNRLTEAEIQAGKGRSEFDSEYFTKSLELWTKYAKDGNQIAVKQLARLRSMDKSLQSFGRGLASTKDGFSLSGTDMTASQSNVLFGLWSEQKTPLGAGIEIATQRVSDLTKSIQALGYQSYKVQSSALFGLFTDESIETNYRELSGAMLKTLQKTVNTTLDSVADNLKVLGFDSERFKKVIQDQVVSLGKINFKDITDPAKQLEVLKNGISEMLGSAVNNALSSFANPEMLSYLKSWQIAGEDILTTTSRVAVGLQQVNNYLHIFGQSVDNFNQSQELIEAAGGLEAFTNGMQTFVQNFLSSAEQKEFLQYQLQNALAVYNIALPASKAQFKALVQETQAKIMATKAQIQTLKAEIVAKVKAGEMSLQAAYGELKGKADIANKYAYVAQQWGKSSNYLIGSANNAGQAVVGFGNNLHRTIEGIKTGLATAVTTQKEYVDGVGEIDYSRITSPAIQALEAQLSELDGLYGTLMSQMSSFASYYNDSATSVISATNSVADSFDDLTKSLIAIANLKAEWGDDPIKGAELVLEATRKVTGLTELTYENFLEKFEELTKDGKGLSDDILSDWQSMSNALKKVHDLQYDAFTNFLTQLRDLANETNNIAGGLINSSTTATLEFTQERYAQQVREFEKFFDSSGNLLADVKLDDVLNSYKELNSLASTLSQNAYQDTKDKLFNSLMLEESKLLQLQNIEATDPRLREQQKTNDKLDEVVKELQDTKSELIKLRAEYERLRRESA